jgi:enamine deaminase RidA (YjgF/YER057c/UK114 family)/uncharacterized protein YjiS (DUF1127 family)
LSGVPAEGCQRRWWPLRDSTLAVGRSILTIFQSWCERSRVRRQLAVMNARDLQDMGICRADIADEIGRPFWREMKGKFAMSKEIFSPATLPPPVGYSHIAKVSKGTLVYIAGQVSSDASGRLVGEGDFEAQVEQVFKNLKLALDAAGATMADIVKMNTYLVAEVGQDDVPKLRAIRERHLNTAKPPASTRVVVSRLARPGWLVEIEVIAAIDG